MASEIPVSYKILSFQEDNIKAGKYITNIYTIRKIYKIHCSIVFKYTRDFVIIYICEALKKARYNT